MKILSSMEGKRLLTGRITEAAFVMSRKRIRALRQSGSPLSCSQDLYGYFYRWLSDSP